LLSTQLKREAGSVKILHDRNTEYSVIFFVFNLTDQEVAGLIGKIKHYAGAADISRSI
jgi:hypothetical protein